MMGKNAGFVKKAVGRVLIKISVYKELHCIDVEA
jgi:hypothetical protein